MEIMINLTPLKAIRKNCLECSGNMPSEVRNCVIKNCPLFNYRFGKNPKRQGIGGKKTVFIQKTAT